MTSRGPGGRIAPDGRPAQVPGQGRNAKRHDLERPATPGLHDSDLQQGDVQALEDGQRIAPIRQQGAAGPQQAAQQPGRTIPQPAEQIPDGVDFIAEQAKGTLGNVDAQTGPQIDVKNYMPLLRRLATSTGASGLLAQAYITQLRNMSVGRTQEQVLIDMQDFDGRVDEMIQRMQSDGSQPI